MTATLQERLDEYQQLLKEIGTTHQHGEPFIRAVFIAVTMQQDVNSRNSYITSMGKTFKIDPTKVERIIALLPA